jgi:hypothetical protein
MLCLSQSNIRTQLNYTHQPHHIAAAMRSG